MRRDHSFSKHLPSNSGEPAHEAHVEPGRPDFTELLVQGKPVFLPPISQVWVER